MTFQLRNPLPAPAALRVELTELENMRPEGDGDVLHAVLEADEQRELGILRIVDPTASHRFRYRWRFLVGAPGATHDPDARYALPFGGQAPRKVSQGPQGGFSHRNLEAYDFLMPEGTPVVAARAGVVAYVVDHHDRGGPRKSWEGQANRVLVLHDDGTLARYLHLRSGAAVKAGDELRVRQLLGWSGNTGFSTAPHLHFDVYRVTRDHEMETVPLRFAGETPEGFRPVPGHYYPPSEVAD